MVIKEPYITCSNRVDGSVTTKVHPDRAGNSEPTSVVRLTAEQVPIVHGVLDYVIKRRAWIPQTAPAEP
jgi:hypothetical protein